MSKVQELFSSFIKIFHFFGFWPEPVLPKWHLRMIFVAYLVLEIFCFILIAASFLEVQNVEDFVISIMYTAGYFWMISCDVNFLHKQQQIQEFMNKLCEIFYQNEEALLFVDSACVIAKKVAKFMTILEISALNFGIILIPTVFRTLLLPMWKFSDVESTTGFTLCLLLQVLSINFVIIHISAVIILWYCFMILINGYSEYLGFKLRTLVSNSKHDGTKDLIECIKIHQNLKSMITDLYELFGVSFGLFFQAVEIIIGTCIFAITKGESRITFGKNLTFYGYIAVLTIDNLMPAYLGNKIYGNSLDFIDDLISSEWIEADFKYKKIMIIFIENLKKPVKMSVLWYENLNLERFKEAMKSGYSSYSLLSKINHINY